MYYIKKVIIGISAYDYKTVTLLLISILRNRPSQ